MAMSTDEIVGLLRGIGCPKAAQLQGGRIAFAVEGTTNYVANGRVVGTLTQLLSDAQRSARADGLHAILLTIELADEGRYFRLTAPSAFEASGPHVAAFLRACLTIQWWTKLVQFEYDESDGEIRPTIEFPLLDAKLTQEQLVYCVKGMAHLLDTYAPALRRALDEGVVEMPRPVLPKRSEMIEALEKMLAQLKSSEGGNERASASGDSHGGAPDAL